MDDDYIKRLREQISNVSPLPFEIDREVWGDVLRWKEVAPGVLDIRTTMAFRPSATGHICFYAVAKGEGACTVSAKALQCAEEHDGVYYFATDGQVFIMEYELSVIKHGGAAAGRQVVQEIWDDFEELGRDMAPEYFGTWPLPEKTPWGRVDQCVEAEHGIWLLHVGGRWVLATAHIVGSGLHDIPMQLSRELPGVKNGLIFWELEKAAPAVYELICLEGYRELMRYIGSMAGLETYLHQFFPDYVAFYNGILDEEIESEKKRFKDLVAHMEREKIKKTFPPVKEYLNLNAFRALEKQQTP